MGVGMFLNEVLQCPSFLYGIYLIQIIGLDPQFLAGAEISLHSFICLTWKFRAKTNKYRVMTAQFQQLLCAGIAALEVIGGDHGHIMVFKVAVKGDKRDPDGYGVAHVGISQSDDSVRFTLRGQIQIADFFFRYAVGTAEDQFIAMLIKVFFYILCKCCKKRIYSVRNNEGNQLRLLGFQSSGISIYLISQFFNSLFYFFSIFFSYGYMVDHFRNCSQGYAGPGANIFHSRCVRRGQDSSPPFL